MPNITAVVWNVETFGDAWNAQRGATYTPICRFIARVIKQVNADIFFMMELRPGGGVYLNTLQALLNTLEVGGAIWTYDYLPGSVVTGQGFPVTQANQLAYTQQGHSEGYAVFWRAPAAFTMLNTRVALSQHPAFGQSQIGLVFTGRTPAFNNNTGWFNAPNFNPGAPPLVWNRLDFPEPRPIHAGDIRFDRSRRPAVCVLNLNRGQGPAQDLVPLVVYHAPNSNFSTRFGVQVSAYSTQLYQVDDTTQFNVTMRTVNQAIIAGDFNLDANNIAHDRNVDAYYAYTTALNGGGGGNTGGANLPNVWVNDTVTPILNCTAIRLRDGNGAINSANPNDYRWLAIDNLFYRGLNAVTPATNYKGPAYNILADIMTGGDLVNTASKQRVIRRFWEAMVTALGLNNVNYPFTNPVNGTPMRMRHGTPGNYVYTGPIIAGLLDYNAYRADLFNGHFSNARRAAEFYFNSISDHLPLVFRFTV